MYSTKLDRVEMPGTTDGVEYKIEIGEPYVPEEVAYQRGLADGRKAGMMEVAGKVPPRDFPRLGSENQEVYIAYAHGFNKCREEVLSAIEAAIKEIK